MDIGTPILDQTVLELIRATCADAECTDQLGKAADVVKSQGQQSQWFGRLLFWHLLAFV